MEEKTVNSPDCAVAWRGHLADETDEDLSFISTTMVDRDLMSVEPTTRKEASIAKHFFRDVLVRYCFGVEPDAHFSRQGFWRLALLYPTGVRCLLPIEVSTEEIAPIDQTLESLIEEAEQRDASTNKYRPIEIDIEHNIVVQMPPLKRRPVKIRVTSIRRAEPHVVYYPVLDE